MCIESKSLKEECGVFGIWDNPHAAQITYEGLHSLQHRGQEGAGIVTTNGKEFFVQRNLGLLAEVFKDVEDLTHLKGTGAIGHVRYATSGNRSLSNVQPFLFHFPTGDIALAHNGNLVNAEQVAKVLAESGAVFHSDSDSEVLIHLIQQSKKTDWLDKVKDGLQQLKGAFAFLLLTKDCLIAALDPLGFRPLSIGQFPNGTYVIASETCALDSVGALYLRDVNPGEMIVIDDKGLHAQYFIEERSHAVCAMEYIYFARPDSDICGVNVHRARKNMGKKLAEESPSEADIVIGVPNSSLSAASGYAEASRLPYEMGIIKNQYIARTFIQPTQALRELSVRRKLSAVRSIVVGQRVVLVDDSIVRGTTIKHLIDLLKEAGAKEVHVRIASPPLKYPCFYGIDFQTADELIAANHTIEEIQKKIGADSLSYLSEDGLIQAIGLDFDAPYSGLCMAYFNGDYPTALYDYEETIKEMEKKDEKQLSKSRC